MAEPIIVGQQYIFTITGHDVELERAGLDEVIGTTFDGLLVNIRSVENYGGVQQVYFSSADETISIPPDWGQFYWPSCCFTPVLAIDFEFVVGEVYICDKVPDDAHSAALGWNDTMSNDYIGVNLKCTEIRADNAILSIDYGGYSFYKRWVRPISSQKPVKPKIVERNVFNVWPK